ncbi:MAG: cation diffusion facilitator family transporter [Candidatus Omnitrophica bacterium]|nr:cation diffusion facilitator family transporter [Candidatus Omnitrophota bacterium]MCM8793238.1 cation diffusion facilitator family transporter [Candidatus Omnitrophota bacterium]
MTVTPATYPKEEKLKRLKLALILTASGMVLEFFGGIVSRSLSLISDSGHMFTHLFALATSYFAILLSLQPVTKKRTYGLYRAEVLAAFVNGIILIFVAFYLIYQSILRFINPREIKVLEMLFVSGIGLVINGITTILLARVSQGDLNIKSAFLHELGDMLSSVAVVISGLIIFYTKKYIFDPLLSFFICLLIFIWSVRLIRDSTIILLESVPKHIDIDLVAKTIKEEIPGIYEVHHIHAWTIATSIYALTCHVVIEDCQVSKANEILEKINSLVKDRFQIEHTNIQFECLLR